MPIRKTMKSEPKDRVAAEGIMRHDFSAITLAQRQCCTRTTMTIQLEQEAYLSQHPELEIQQGEACAKHAGMKLGTFQIFAMLELFISNQVKQGKRQANAIKDAGEFFLRPLEELENEIRARLGLEIDEPFLKTDKEVYSIDDEKTLEADIKAILNKHHPPKTWHIPTPSVSPPMTRSSSFISIRSSDTTLPTPEPIPTPEPTLSEHLMVIVSNTVDKAFVSRFDEQAILYDAAYVAVALAVEEAMEIPVIEIREDIAELFFEAYKMFESEILDKERIAAEIAWEKRMRKKMKRTVRRQANFKGYEPAPSTSSISTHESYKVPPPKPCVCHPQWRYNRIPKDRFGIYLPREEQYPTHNMTVSPVISVESLSEEVVAEENPDSDAKSIKSTVSKSVKNDKTTPKSVKIKQN